MKKSVVAVGVLVALGAVWAGGAWYTGKTAEEQLQSQINHINQKFAFFLGNSGDELKIDNVKFNRGFFSSDLNYDLVITAGAQKQTYSVPFGGKVHHGPLPLNQVSAFNFAPAVFSADIALVKNEKTQNWFAKSGKNPIQAVVAMSYAKQFTGELNSEVDTVIDDGNISWKFATEFDVNQDGIGRFESVMPHFKIMPPKGYSGNSQDEIENMVMTFTDGKGSADFKQASAELNKTYVGKYHSQIGKMQMTGKKNGEDILLEIDNFTLDLEGKLADKFVDYGLTYKIGGLKANGDGANNFNLGELVFNLQLNHLDAKSVNTVFDEISKLEPNSQAAMPKAVEEAFQEMLKNQPQFKISPLSLTNPNGKMAADLNITLANADFAAAFAGNVVQLFKEFNVNINVDKPAVTHLTSTVLQSSMNLSKEEADKAAAEQVEQALQQLRDNQVILEDDKTVKFGLNLEEKGFNFNGRVLTNEEVQAAVLGAIMMFGMH